MSDSSVTYEVDEQPHTTVKGYLLIFLWLCIFTAIEVGVTFIDMPKSLLVFFLIGTAIVKAALVAAYFMHLKFEGRLIFLIAGFPCVIATVFVLALFPDLVIGYWE